MGRIDFIFGACAVILLVFGAAPTIHACRSSNSSLNACPPELQQCVELLKHRELCSKLENICTAIANGNASHHIAAFNQNQCPIGRDFCPTTQSCQPVNTTCDLNTPNNACKGSIASPWGENCSQADHEFCTISMSCIHNNAMCSLRAIHEWSLAMNTSYGPYGTSCTTDKTFCLSTMKCINSSAEACHVSLNATAFKGFCTNDSNVFCPKRASCIEANSSCTSFQPVNLTTVNDTGLAGWKYLCEARQSFCTRYSAGLEKCFPLVSHCLSASISPSVPPCTVNETYCNSTLMCQAFDKPCCLRNESFCNYTGKCHHLDEPCCPENYTFCNHTRKCYRPDVPCCPQNHTFCNYTGKCHQLEESCCPENYTFCNHTRKCYRPDVPCCPQNHTFCNYTGKCHQLEESCCPENYTFCNYTGKCHRPSKPCCPQNHTFCNHTRNCHRPDLPCCQQNHTFCNYTEKCLRSEELCCPQNQTFCKHTAKCHQLNEPCCPENHTFCNTTGLCHRPEQLCCPQTQVLCQYSQRCHRLDEPCCHENHTYCNTTGLCHHPKQLCCPENKTFCTYTAKCHRPDEPCCPENHTFCNSTKLCHHPKQFCCSQNQTFCNLTAKCHRPDEPCCPQNHTFCNTTRKCQPPKEPCCPQNHTLCNYTRQCKMAKEPCCPQNHTFCNTTRKCQLPKEACCPQNHTLCNYTRQCQLGNESCCPHNLILCNYTGKCQLPKEPCCHQNHVFCNYTRRCQMSNESCCPHNLMLCNYTGKCQPSSEHCCPQNHIFCNSTGKCQPGNAFCCLGTEYQCLNDKQYKVVADFQTLGETSKNMFFNTDTIAITFVDVVNGTSKSTDYSIYGNLQFFHNNEWIAAPSGISPSKAFVLGKENMIRFIGSANWRHGVVLLNFTKKTGAIGEVIDASSSFRGPLDVIALFVFPHAWPPNVFISEHGSPCEMNEDDSSNPGIIIKSKVALNGSEYSTESNIPSKLEPFLSAAGPLTIYKGLLDFANSSRPAVSIRPGEDTDTKKAGRLDFDSLPAYINDLSRRFKFEPKQDYNGRFTVEFSGGMMYTVSKRQPANSFLLPLEVGRLIYPLIVLDKLDDKVVDKYFDILGSLEPENKPPTKENVLTAAANMERQASGANKTIVTAAKNLLSKAFTLGGKIAGGKMTAMTFKTVVVNKDSKRLIFMYSKSKLALKCKVLPVNDAPRLKKFSFRLKPIAFNTTVNPNNGYSIEDMISGESLVSDVDVDAVPGFYLCNCAPNKVGSYYWRGNAHSNWTLITVNNKELNGEKEVLLLGPKAQLKFVPKDRNKLWSNSEAIQFTTCTFGMWDGSDNKTSGLHNFKFPTSQNSSLSARTGFFFASREGCDGKPGSGRKYDACGKCGGDGQSCRGCDGVLHSGAKFDDCGNCTGGNTNRTFNFLLDCAKGCGTSFKDSCGECQTYGMINSVKDCNGTCHGTAKLNRCNLCVMGNTGKPETFGQDMCGVCGGDNSSCLDCAGTPKGKKKWDRCGNCYDPTDAKYNAECTKLWAQPISGDFNDSNVVTFRAAGLQKFKRVSSFQMVSTFLTTYTMTDVQFVNNKEISAKVPKLTPVGLYSFRVQFDNVDTYYHTENNFTLYNRSEIIYHSLTPEEHEADSGAFNVTITGENFPDTGYTKCITDVGLIFPAIYVNSTSITCVIWDIKRSARFKLSPQFGASDTDIILSASFFRVFVWSPYPLRANLSQSLQSIRLQMNQPAEYDSKLCKGLFTDVSAFGSHCVCTFSTPTLLEISLLGDPTIAPGDQIHFKDGTLKRKFEKYTKVMAPNNRTLVLGGPPKGVRSVAQLSGPNTVGACAQVQLDASRSFGGGGRKLKFFWYVVWASDQNTTDLTANATADIKAINDKLKSLPSFTRRITLTKENIILNFKYEFRVYVSNFLGTKSENATLVVVRENKEIPIVELGETRRQVKASRDLMIQAKPKLSPCVNTDAATILTFNWEIPGVDLGISNRPVLIIKSGLLQGGKEYRLTLVASMATDPSLYYTQTITLIVESSPLLARIDGGLYRVIGAEQILTLNARPSRDPDRSSEPERFTWAATDSEGKSVFYRDSSNKKTRLQMPSSAKISIDVEKTLKSNSIYTFKVTYHKGQRQASKEVKVKVLPGTPPSALITEQEETEQNPNKILIIEAFAESKNPFSVHWDVVEDNECGYIDLRKDGVALTRTDLQFNKGGEKTFALVLSKNSLESGVCYRFRLNVSNADSNATSETVIYTNAPPSQGTFVINPSNGTAMENFFFLDAESGWSDNEDHLPLVYRFGYYTKDQEEIPLNFFDESTSISGLLLPQGDAAQDYSLNLFVEVKDKLGAVTRQTTTVQVKPPVITEDFLEKSETNALKILDEGNYGKGIAQIGSLLVTIDSNNIDSTKSKKALAMKEKFGSKLADLIKTSGLAEDSKSKSDCYQILLTTTKGGTEFSAETKITIFDTIFSIEIGTKAPTRRRRRATSSSSSIEVYSVAQAKTTLSLQSNLIDPNLYDSTSMKFKSQFLAVVDSTGKKVCAGLAVGMPASVVSDKLIALRSEKNSFENVGESFTEMVCDNCNTNLNKTAKVKLGAELQSKYASWNCSGSKLCAGACLVTSQQVYNLLDTSPPKDSLTSVVDVKLYNPSTYTTIDVSGLATPLTYHLPVLNVTINKPFFQCKRWDTSSSSWTSTGCVTTPSYIVNNGTKYVQCNCTELGYTAAFQSNTTPPTTTPTTVPITPTTTASTVKKRRVRLVLKADYDKYVTPEKKEQFIKDVKQSLAKTMNINESRITNMTITKGSIVVTFVLIPDIHDTEASLNSTVLLLGNAVKSDNFRVELSDGTSLMADPNSFTFTVGDEIPTAPTTAKPAPTDTSTGLTQGQIIAIACACSAVVLVVVIILVVICWKKNRPRKVNSEVSLSRQHLTNDVEMREHGHDNPEQEQVSEA